MKKFISTMLVGAVAMSMFVGCGSDASKTETATQTTEGTTGSENVKIDKLTIGFVPSREPDEIVTATEPLKDMLTDELAGLGYEVGQVDITVGTSFEAVGEGLAAGTIDVGLIPGGTYVLYDDGCDVLLTATRDGLSIDSDSAKDWNDNKPTEATSDQVTYYRALIIAGPSKAGQAVAEKVNSGEELTWEDLDGLNWSVMNSSSPAGYIYPSLWLQDKYRKHITDLSHTALSDNYGTAFSRLASGQVDVLVTYADARRDNEDKWTSEYGRSASIWDETNVIGVTDGIYNDTISVSKSSPIMDDAFKAALSKAFINIGNTDAGKEVISIYSHNGYVEAKSEDYDSERKAQELIMSLQ
ncbi:phosphonate transport system substrate-binding protein [Pseudobutyrivibrio sp. ACV-2]|uniref:phosphate/phosphite/phosphonate ABC transporter substrate-binding protein n=1 Tax=Pseudobutyrivibrio sp. ACV-2 TaxID=1520801 RepID=UPI0008997D2A|nr:PhnD/SsuA/transferrin family substrate-binding protein [Pseudobutyrivibrio sp. ACV-2]SEA38434.1 phosphonate transport system substrate-binding protein [Pseudobutyrivibrio sp. ACV-2]